MCVLIFFVCLYFFLGPIFRVCSYAFRVCSFFCVCCFGIDANYFRLRRKRLIEAVFFSRNVY